MIGQIEKVEGLLDGTYRIALLTHQKPDIQPLIDKPVNISITEQKRHRSLDANAYYWVLLSKLAEHMGVSKPFCHNFLLNRYGQIEVIDGRAVYVVLCETDTVQKRVEEDSFLHLRPTAQVKDGTDGRQYRTYMLLKGSHEYNTKEMSCLINGLVSECKEVGIETLPDKEIERMMQHYKQKQAEAHEHLEKND